MPRWLISPSAASPVRARFALAALAGHAALAALLLGHRPRPLPEPAALPVLLLELAAPAPVAPPAAAAEAVLVAADLAEPPPAGPVTWPTPRPAARHSVAPVAASAAGPGPAVAPAAVAPAAVAPVAVATGAVTLVADSAAIAAWQAALLAWIEQHRRYPPAARFRAEEGVVRVRFELDPAGRVLHAEIAAESGSAALDAAALALLRGATLPAPPPGTAAAARLVTAPIHYRLQ